MARIRTIKPEFWSHPVMGKASDSVKCLALALLNLADDEGYFLADPCLVRSFARPFDEDSTSVRAGLEHLSILGWIEVKTNPSHGAIGRIVNFQEHQKIDRPSQSKIKSYFLDEHSTNDRRTLVAGTGNREQGTGNINSPLPPTVAGGDPADAGKKNLRMPRKPTWSQSHAEPVVDAALEIKGFWPSPEDGNFQPDRKTPVPGLSMAELAGRLAEIERQGGELAVCVECARQAVREWKTQGKWIKAPQHFFGSSKDAPWQAYYQAHLTNIALQAREDSP